MREWKVQVKSMSAKSVCVCVCVCVCEWNVHVKDERVKYVINTACVCLRVCEKGFQKICEMCVRLLWLYVENMWEYLDLSITPSHMWKMHEDAVCV